MKQSGSDDTDPAGRTARAGDRPAQGLSPAKALRVAAIGDVAGGRQHRVRVGGLDLFVVMVDGRVYACDNTCAHQHFAELHNGLLSGCLVTCPMHGWTYDVRTGLSTTGEGRIRSYTVTLRDGDIFVDVE